MLLTFILKCFFAVCFPFFYWFGVSTLIQSFSQTFNSVKLFRSVPEVVRSVFLVSLLNVVFT